VVLFLLPQASTLFMVFSHDQCAFFDPYFKKGPMQILPDFYDVREFCVNLSLLAYQASLVLSWCTVHDQLVALISAGNSASGSLFDECYDAGIGSLISTIDRPDCIILKTPIIAAQEMVAATATQFYKGL